jgi:hypothetical protein
VIRAICGPNGAPTFESSVSGIAIYLDNFAIKSLAKGEPALRRRFVDALKGGADLLFSGANAVELSGSQGSSSTIMKEFLDEMGPHWYPVDILLDNVMKREAAGEVPGKCCLDEELLRAYFANRTSDQTPGSGKVIDLSERFFRLGAFVDWLAPQRSWFLSRSREFDEAIKEKIGLLRARLKGDPGWLDRVLPQPQFNPQIAANFAYRCLIRALVCDAGFQVRKGDGIDFHHAVIASAFASFAALDKQWKRRIENLPKPNRVSRVYYEPELGAMVTDIELGLVQLKALRWST